MRVSLIVPPMPFGWTPVAPPVLEYLGALTKMVMPDAELRLIDGSAAPVSENDIDADLVGISLITATAVAGYRLADGLRNKGIDVVLGGIHPTARPEEAREHADSVVVGEAESVWADVLKDASNGQLKPLYFGQPLNLDGLPLPLHGCLEGKYRFRAVSTMRGCPYNCTFCSVKQFFGKTIRYRPIEEVVKEVEAIPGNIYFISDENIWAGNIQRAIDVFTALRGTNKKWLGFGSLGVAESDKWDHLLKAARESGLVFLWVGWETFTDEGLKRYRANRKMGRNREEAIKRIKDCGIDITLSVMLGGRADTLDDFDRTVEVADRLGVSIHPSLVVPYPGTKLYEEYEPFLMKDRGWDFYTGDRAVFEHPLPGMAPEAREEKFYDVSIQLLSLKRTFKHLLDIPLSGFPTAHIVSMMTQLPIRHGMRKAYEKWKGTRAAEGRK
jgi:radical SAM superfamily enzyme YgiQ (UPF0313 family)